MNSVRCPHCHETVELAGGEDADVAPDGLNAGAIESPTSTAAVTETLSTSSRTAVCPSCGGTIDLAAEMALDSTKDAAPLRWSIAHFELLEELGAGAFGTVYRARDTRLDRIVAIKIPREDRLNPTDADLFLREARAAAQLKHPGIVGVHEVGRDDGRSYIVSDFIEGVTLTDWLTGRPISFFGAAELCRKIAEALEHAHSAGVVHRDLKPGNIMLDAADQPYVMDFGLARRESDDVTISGDGKVMGTPAYMSPEQARGDAHAADRRSDVYSLGVVLFQLVTGERPFRGSVRMLLFQIQHDEPPSPRKLNAAVPKDLETICLKCLEKQPSRRYATAKDLADELQRYLSGRPIHARPISRPTRVWRWCKRNRLATGLVGSVMLLLLTLAIAVPWIVAERAERERQAALSEAEKDRDIRETRARAKERLTAASAALNRGDPRNAIEQYSEAIGLTADLPEFHAVQREAVQQRSQLIRYVRFLTAEQEIARHIYDDNSATFRDPEADRNLQIMRVNVFDRRRILKALELFGLMQKENSLREIDRLPLPAVARESLRKKSEGLYWRLLEGLSLKRLGRKSAEEGLIALDGIVEIAGHSRAELLLRKLFCERLGQHGDANRADERLQGMKVKTSRDAYWQGVLLLERGQTQLAKLLFTRALKEDPAHFLAHYRLFQCLHKTKDIDGQLRELTACLAITPHDARLFLLRGMTRYLYVGYSLETFLASEFDFDAALERDAKLPEAWFYRGRLRIRMLRWLEAEKDLLTALKLDPKLIWGQYYLALCRAHLGRIGRAVAEADAAVKARPADGKSHFFAARTYAVAAGKIKLTNPTLSKQRSRRAIELLKKAKTLGYSRKNPIELNRDFDSVRSHPDFPKVPTAPKK